MSRIAEQKVHFTEDTGIPVLVLILEIRAVRPFQDDDLELVLAVVQVFCKLEFARHVSDLAVTYEFIVAVQEESAVNALEHRVNALLFKHIIRQSERLYVQTARIVRRNERGIERERILTVRILRNVVSLAELRLPAARYLYRIEVDAVKLRDLRKVSDGIEVSEVPHPAKRFEISAFSPVLVARRLIAVSRDEVCPGLFASDVQCVIVHVVIRKFHDIVLY